MCAQRHRDDALAGTNGADLLTISERSSHQLPRCPVRVMPGALPAPVKTGDATRARCFYRSDTEPLHGATLVRQSELVRIPAIDGVCADGPAACLSADCLCDRNAGSGNGANPDWSPMASIPVIGSADNVTGGEFRAVGQSFWIGPVPDACAIAATCWELSLIHNSEPTIPRLVSSMPSSA